MWRVAVFFVVFLLLGRAILAFSLLLTTLVALRMCRNGVFVVASDIIQSLFVYLDAVSGQNLYIFYNHLVIRMVKVVFVALGAHITGNIAYGVVDALILRTVGEGLENTAHILTIVLEADEALRIVQSARCRLQILA